MKNNVLIECVPNFSEGRNADHIKQIADSISSVGGVKLLNVDPGHATNRTVMTFVGEPDAVIEAAFLGIKKASELIDMSKHSGEHPRMGATDVCPLIPIRGISIEETVEYAKALGQRVGQELHIPVYLYEAAANLPERKNLASIRSGEYEGLEQKLANPKWKPDFGKNEFNPSAGATVIGVRDFLVAYNVNINSSSVRRANAIAFDVREQGRVKRNRTSGEIMRDESGQPLRSPGVCKAVKAIGWYIEEYGLAQISMNLTDLTQTPMHMAFEACRESANRRGLRVTGSELIGLVPKSVLIDAGKYFLQKQGISRGLPEAEIIKIAVKSMGLDELAPFDPSTRIIEYLISDGENYKLVTKTLSAFADETSTDSPAPGGGSVAAYVGGLGVALVSMVANLSAHKSGWEKSLDQFSSLAEQAQSLKEILLKKVDEDTNAFNGIMAAIRLPKNTEVESNIRTAAIEKATIVAIEVPLSVMEVLFDSLNLMKDVAKEGNPNSISDVGVGILCAYAGIIGAYLNVKINCKDLADENLRSNFLARGEEYAQAAEKAKAKILSIVEQRM